jgi:hypothetical protein
MNWEVWQQIEETLRDMNVKPLLAIIPDNRDPDFQLASSRPDFWDRVRFWQSLDWAIGVHGYQHTYVTRCSGLLGLHRGSEFAGLTGGEQERKIKLAVQIFRNEGLDPKVWIAPGHSFDATTLRVLRQVGLRVVSDGFSILPHEDGNGILWIPQQMWRFRRVPFGVWTICFHHNFWGPGAISRFRSQLSKYCNQVSCFGDVIDLYGGRMHGPLDVVAARTLGSLTLLKQALQKRGLKTSEPKLGPVQ